MKRGFLCRRRGRVRLTEARQQRDCGPTARRRSEAATYCPARKPGAAPGYPDWDAEGSPLGCSSCPSPHSGLAWATHTVIHTRTHTATHTCTHSHAHTYTHTQSHAHVHTHTQSRSHSHANSPQTHSSTYTHIHAHTHSHSHAHTPLSHLASADLALALYLDKKLSRNGRCQPCKNGINGNLG